MTFDLKNHNHQTQTIIVRCNTIPKTTMPTYSSYCSPRIDNDNRNWKKHTVCLGLIRLRDTSQERWEEAKLSDVLCVKMPFTGCLQGRERSRLRIVQYRRKFVRYPSIILYSTNDCWPKSKINTTSLSVISSFAITTTTTTVAAMPLPSTSIHTVAESLPPPPSSSFSPSSSLPPMSDSSITIPPPTSTRTISPLLPFPPPNNNNNNNDNMKEQIWLWLWLWL